jgi:hypothetical protein
MAGGDDLKVLAELLSAILAPMHDVQNKQSQALVLSSQQLQRLADMLQTEPSRQAVIDAIRNTVNDHMEEVTSLVQRVQEAVITAINLHNDGCTIRNTVQTERDVHRETESLTTLRGIVETAVQPAKELAERWDRLKWEVRLAYGVCIGLAGYLIWIYHNLIRPLSH